MQRQCARQLARSGLRGPGPGPQRPQCQQPKRSLAQSRTLRQPAQHLPCAELHVASSQIDVGAYSVSRRHEAHEDSAGPM